MSYLYGSPSPHEHSQQQQSEEYDQEAVMEGLRNFQRKKTFARLFTLLHSSIKFNTYFYAFQILKRNQQKNSKEKRVKKLIFHLSKLSNRLNGKLKAFEKIQKYMYQQRKRQTLVHLLFCNKFVHNQYKNIQEALSLWKGKIVNEKQTNKEIKSQYEKGKKNFGIRFIVRIFKHKYKSHFYHLKTFSKTRKNKSVLFLMASLTKLFRKNVLLCFSQIQNSSVVHCEKPYCDDPVVFENMLKHMCFITGKKQKKLSNQTNLYVKLKEYKILKIVLLLNRKVQDGKRACFQMWKRRIFDDHFQFKQRAKQLESIKLRYIEDFI